MARTVNVSESNRAQVQPGANRLTLKHLSVLLVVIGLAITGYMSYAKLTATPVPCIENSVFSCAEIESSAWASLKLPQLGLEIPTAILGFMAHVLIGALLLLETRVPFFKDNGVMLLFGFTFFCLIYHAYLTFYVSAVLLGTYCPWCLAAAATMLFQFIVTSLRLRRQMTAAQ